jgi:hypothetical protein
MGNIQQKNCLFNLKQFSAYMYVLILSLHLMVISGLVSRIPDVRQRHRRVEPVEDAEGQGHVLDDGPKFGAVKVLLLQTISV